MRAENCAMAAVAVVVGMVIAGLSGFDPVLLPAVVSVFLITAGGNAINDFFDAEVDRKNAPHRPVPSGKITPAGVVYFSSALFILGNLAAYFINIWALLLALINSQLLVRYAMRYKNSVGVGNVMISYLTASTFVYGGLAMGNVAPVFFLFLMAFLVNLGREIIGDVEDMDGDRRSGLKTLAIRLGAKKSWRLASVFIIAAVAISPVPYVIGLFGQYYMFVAVADAVILWSIIQRNPRMNQRLTKIGIGLGLAAFLFGTLKL